MNNIVNKILPFILVAVLSACSNDVPERETSPLSDAVSFSQSNPSLQVWQGSEDFFTVELQRPNASVAAQYDLELSGDVLDGTNETLFSLDGSKVSFEAGKTTATVKVKVGNVQMLKKYDLVFKVNSGVGNPYIGTAGEYRTTFVYELEWEEFGVANVSSDWAANEIEVPVERAKGSNYYRLNSPYFYLEPDYCPDEGYHLVFELDESENAVGILAERTNIGENDDLGNSYFFVYSKTLFPEQTSFTNVDNVYTLKGVLVKSKSETDAFVDPFDEVIEFTLTKSSNE